MHGLPSGVPLKAVELHRPGVVRTGGAVGATAVLHSDCSSKCIGAEQQRQAAVRHMHTSVHAISTPSQSAALSDSSFCVADSEAGAAADAVGGSWGGLVVTAGRPGALQIAVGSSKRVGPVLVSFLRCRQRVTGQRLARTHACTRCCKLGSLHACAHLVARLGHVQGGVVSPAAVQRQ